MVRAQTGDVVEKALKAWVVPNGAPQASCGKDTVGALRHDDQGALMMCGKDGKWGNVSPPTVGRSRATPGKSCADLKKNKFDTGSGLYWLGTATKPYTAFCDMSKDGEATGDGSTKDKPAASCLSVFTQYGTVKGTAAKFWLRSGKAVVQVMCVLSLAGVEMNGDGSAVQFTASSCQMILDNFALKNGDKRYVGGKLVTCDVASGKAKIRATKGLTPADPAESCKEIKAAGKTKDGIYYVKSTSGTQKVYCDLNTNGGGWALVIKVSNHDKDNFYCKGSNGPLQRGAEINAGDQWTLGKRDMIGKAYKYVKQTELMVTDLNTKEWLSGTFSGSKSLWDRIKTAGGGNQGGAFSCSLRATNFKKKGGKVGGIDPKWLGIKCEDDNQRSWACDDDAVFIGWNQQFNAWHRNGIAKCGCDGGSDIYCRFAHTRTPDAARARICTLQHLVARCTRQCWRLP